LGVGRNSESVLRRLPENLAEYAHAIPPYKSKDPALPTGGCAEPLDQSLGPFGTRQLALNIDKTREIRFAWVFRKRSLGVFEFLM
jgi:hypothetical protein